MTTSLLMEFI